MQKKFAVAIVFLLSMLLITTSYLYLATPPEASSDSVGDYFNISYDPAIFSKTNIVKNEAFSVTIHGNATCTDDLPPIRNGRIVCRVVASNVSTGHRIIINSQYTVNVNPFPNDPGEYTEMTAIVSLQFPASEIPGDYSIVGETIKAEVYLLGDWKDVTDTVPASHVLGNIHYTTTGTTSTPTPTPTHTSTPSVTPTPSATATPGATTSPGVTASPSATASSGVTATPSASATTYASSSATATTTTSIATPGPTGTITAGTPSLTPNGSASPAHYGAPIWTAIGLSLIHI